MSHLLIWETFIIRIVNILQTKVLILQGGYHTKYRSHWRGCHRYRCTMFWIVNQFLAQKKEQRIFQGVDHWTAGLTGGGGRVKWSTLYNDIFKNCAKSLFKWSFVSYIDILSLVRPKLSGEVKKLGKYGQADRFMLTPPPKRSGKCEIFSTSCHIWGYLPFHKGQHFSQIVSVKLGQPDRLSVLRNFGVSIILRSLVAALHGVYYSSNQIDKHPML